MGLKSGHTLIGMYAQGSHKAAIKFFEISSEAQQSLLSYVIVSRIIIIFCNCRYHGGLLLQNQQEGGDVV